MPATVTRRCRPRPKTRCWGFKRGGVWRGQRAHANQGLVIVIIRPTSAPLRLSMPPFPVSRVDCLLQGASSLPLQCSVRVRGSMRSLRLTLRCFRPRLLIQADSEGLEGAGAAPLAQGRGARSRAVRRFSVSRVTRGRAWRPGSTTRMVRTLSTSLGPARAGAGDGPRLRHHRRRLGPGGRRRPPGVEAAVSPRPPAGVCGGGVGRGLTELSRRSDWVVLTGDLRLHSTRATRARLVPRLR